MRAGTGAPFGSLRLQVPTNVPEPASPHTHSMPADSVAQPAVMTDRAPMEQLAEAVSATDPGRLVGGELNAAVTSALVGIQSSYLGRGPSTASTFHHNNVIVTLMSDVLTKAERTLADSEHSDAVINARRLYGEAMEGEFIDAVQRLTGRRVNAVISGHRLSPDIAATVFVMDSPV